MRGRWRWKATLVNDNVVFRASQAVSPNTGTSVPFPQYSQLSDIVMADNYIVSLHTVVCMSESRLETGRPIRKQING